MKIIDLLNKIANGEEIPMFEYNFHKYKYNEEHHWFDDLDNVQYCKTTFNVTDLNDEIEIIEDTLKKDKKIEKIQLTNGGLTIHLSDFEDYNLNIIDREIIKKLNEIIDRLNGKE